MKTSVHINGRVYIERPGLGRVRAVKGQSFCQASDAFISSDTFDIFCLIDLFLHSCIGEVNLFS